MIKSLDQPIFDNSILPTFLVSEFARKEVKVVLSGDGGDEPFAGYDWTRYALAIPDLPLKWSPGGWQWSYQRGMNGFLKRLSFDITHTGNDRYLRRMTVAKSMRHWLYTPEFREQCHDGHAHDLEKILCSAPVRDARDRFTYTDLCTYLPEDVLFKVDRMSMAHSLEVRVPLLDHHLLEWVLQLPFGMRYRHGHGKYLLRKVAARYLPPMVLKPRKQGFTVPIGSWLRGKLLEPVTRLFNSETFRQRGIVRPQAALELMKMHLSNRFELGHRIWSLVIFEMWARMWLDGSNSDE